MRSTKTRETSPRLVNSRNKLRPLPLSRRPQEGSFRRRRILQTRPPSLRPFRSRRQVRHPVEILVDRLRINRSLAREALAELEQKGVIKKIVGHHKLNMYSTFQILGGRNKSTEADYLCSSERLSLPSRGCVDCVWEKCSVFLHTLMIM
jgi:hypothetical protein